jgi:hypothetical protein
VRERALNTEEKSGIVAKRHKKRKKDEPRPRNTPGEMNQPSREASSFVPDPRNYGGQDGGQAADLRRWRYGDGAMGRSLTPQLIPVLQAVCAPGFADGVSLF